jgi:hypothetical protein
MIVVIFEVWPAQGRQDDYLGILSNRLWFELTFARNLHPTV